MSNQSLRIENWELRNGPLPEPPGGGAERMKAPNPKLQIPKKLQFSSSNTLAGHPSLEFGALDFFGVWGFVFGILHALLP